MLSLSGNIKDVPMVFSKVGEGGGLPTRLPMTILQTSAHGLFEKLCRSGLGFGYIGIYTVRKKTQFGSLIFFLSRKPLTRWEFSGSYNPVLSFLVVFSVLADDQRIFVAVHLNIFPFRWDLRTAANLNNGGFCFARFILRSVSCTHMLGWCYSFVDFRRP